MRRLASYSIDVTASCIISVVCTIFIAGVTFQFLETEYASQEESGVVAIGLQRSMSVQLATDLALRVTPLTYREADDRGITIPLDVPVAASRKKSFCGSSNDY